MELRIYAEDAFNDFLPSVGTLVKYEEPAGEYVRVDSGYRQGDEIPVFYDPLISKLVVWGADRIKCIQEMKKAIDAYRIVGAQTTLAFGSYVMQHPAFVSGDFDTGFVGKYFDNEIKNSMEHKDAELASIIAVKLYRSSENQDKRTETKPSAWRVNVL